MLENQLINDKACNEMNKIIKKFCYDNGHYLQRPEQKIDLLSTIDASIQFYFMVYGTLCSRPQNLKPKSRQCYE